MKELCILTYIQCMCQSHLSLCVVLHLGLSYMVYLSDEVESGEDSAVCSRLVLDC